MENIKVVVAIVENRKGQLLFQHRKKQPYQSYLGLVGGKIEVCKTREQALFREIEEETGLVSHQAQFLGKVTESLITNTNTTNTDLYVYGIKAADNLRASESEGNVFWINRRSFITEK